MVRVHNLILVHFLTFEYIDITDIDHLSYIESGVILPHQKERVNTCRRCNHSKIAILGGSTKLESYVGTLLWDKEIASRNLDYLSAKVSISLDNTYIRNPHY